MLLVLASMVPWLLTCNSGMLSRLRTWVMAQSIDDREWRSVLVVRVKLLRLIMVRNACYRLSAMWGVPTTSLLRFKSVASTGDR